MKGKARYSALRDGAVSGGNQASARGRAFELAFAFAFLVYMGRNLLTPQEWLTSAGFHLADGLQRPGAMPALPLLPVWAIPAFACVLLVAASFVSVGAPFRRIGFAALALIALYAEGVDSASAFALNKIYFAGFVLLALAPTSAERPIYPTAMVTRAFQVVLAVLYFATGLTKVKSGDWLAHSDALWTHAQSYYTTGVAAFFLRHLPSGAWTALQYSVLTFELGAPIWFAWCRTRPFAILFGLSFHLGIALMMKAVWVFSLQMVSFYPLFLSEELASGLLRRLRLAFRCILKPDESGNPTRV